MIHFYAIFFSASEQLIFSPRNKKKKGKIYYGKKVEENFYTIISFLFECLLKNIYFTFICVQGQEWSLRMIKTMYNEGIINERI